jgi:hypothetical protein
VRRLIARGGDDDAGSREFVERFFHQQRADGGVASVIGVAVVFPSTTSRFDEEITLARVGDDVHERRF